MASTADVKTRVLDMLTEGLGIQVQLRPENEVLVELPDSSTAVFIRFVAKEFEAEEINDQVIVGHTWIQDQSHSCRRHNRDI